MQTEISFSLIFNQSLNFIKNRRWQILFMSAVFAIFSELLSSYFMDATTRETLSYADMLSKQDLYALLFRLGLFTLINTLVVGGGMVASIYNLSISHSLNFTLLLSNTLSNMLKILGFSLIYIAILIFATGFIGLILFVISLISTNLGSLIGLILVIICVCLFMSAYYFFLGSIVEPSMPSFFEMFSRLHKNLKKYWKLAVLMVLIRTLLAIIIGVINMQIEPNFLVNIILTSLTNIIDFIVIGFFYRLYTLIAITNQSANDVKI